MFSFLGQLIELIGALGLTLSDILSSVYLLWGLAALAIVLISYLLVRFFQIGLYDILLYMRKFMQFVMRRASGRTTYVMLMDEGGGTVAATFSRRLRRELKSEGVRHPRVLLLAQGDDFMHTPIKNYLVRGIIIINTDVTTLSNNAAKRSFIQSKLRHYVTHGGSLVLTHDTLYRRVKNDVLQELAGGTINRFRPIDTAVDYQKLLTGERRTKNSTLLDQLPEGVQLKDNEVVSGEWAAGVEYIYVWAQDREVPLVTRREVGEGIVFWCNTGDRDAKGAPPALANGDSQFPRIISKILVHGNRHDG